MISADIYPAHIRIQENGDKIIQTVAEHLSNTAFIAVNAAHQYGMERSAYLLGIVHDAGKLSTEFKDYIEKAADKENVRRGSVNHTFSGVRLIMSHHHKDGNQIDNIALEVLAYAVGAHHGLFDCVTDKGINEFERRLQENHPECDESIEHFYRNIMNEAQLNDLIAQAIAEIRPFFDQCKKICASSQQMKYCIALLARFLLSFLIDADRMDTAAFMEGDMACKTSCAADWSAFKAHADAMYNQMTEHAALTPVNRSRQAIAAECVDAICGMGNVMRLNIPTGAGKTITALRSALRLAEKRNKSHIIYTAPLLSIIEQNAKEIQRYIGDDAAILEHHSDVVMTKDDEDIMRSHDLLVQNWSAPVIITTMVQLLNTLFDGSTASVRRFHSLANSVIIIDEIQTIPKKMLTLFDIAVSFLSTACSTTFILCSATQPNLEKAHTPLSVPVMDLMPYRESIWQPFRRTDLIAEKGMRLAEIPAFIERIMHEHGSLLVVCNKKSEAVFLVNSVSLPDTHIVHLSASMCLNHRRQVLETVKTLLEKRQRVLCVATQVIEAGVDISFECMIRLAAGMDSVIQAAGRCNRHGENKSLAPVYIIPCMDEKLTHLPDIQAGKTATLALLDNFMRDPAQYGGRLESDMSIQMYYAMLYQNMAQGSQDMPIKGSSQSMYQLLSDNAMCAGQDPCHKYYYMAQAFKKAGEAFEVFDTGGKAVIVPWGMGSQIIEDLQNVYIDDHSSVLRLVRQARPYTVTVYDHQVRQLREAGGIMELLNGDVYALCPQFYDEKLGLTLPDNQFLEV